ncbi:hypothetical protein CTA2_6523 [Colletotrichum tanaceti]|uniref:Uncharacterized protein n=1 Tax=Colletotrichum tanaceti TaxID=1306861 RepID=A0A4U6XFU1_9PEZI|nr:hypothetical protein CTA2_6523 [Colletotrichum tanaceti]TKW54424.1 hypothetical protein CTA1_470 [Colletotrichum tanaceti]
MPVVASQPAEGGRRGRGMLSLPQILFMGKLTASWTSLGLPRRKRQHAVLAKGSARRKVQHPSPLYRASTLSSASIVLMFVERASTTYLNIDDDTEESSQRRRDPDNSRRFLCPPLPRNPPAPLNTVKTPLMPPKDQPCCHGDALLEHRQRRCTVCPACTAPASAREPPEDASWIMLVSMTSPGGDDGESIESAARGLERRGTGCWISAALNAARV